MATNRPKTRPHLNSCRYQVKAGRLTRHHDFSRIFSRLKQIVIVTTSSIGKVPSALSIALCQSFPPCSDDSLPPFGLFDPTILDCQNRRVITSILNVDLRLFVKAVEKDSSIDLSSMDSERIHGP